MNRLNVAMFAWPGRPRRRCWCVPAAVAACLCLAAAAPAGVLLEDHFTVGQGPRQPGADLHGTQVEVGGSTWVANPFIDFQADHTISRPLVTEGNVVAAAAFTPPPQKVLSLKARIRSEDTAVPGAFMAAGFTADAQSGLPFWSNGGAELWIHIRSNGEYEVLANGANHVIPTPGGVAPGFVAGGFNIVELLYDSAANTVTALINNQVVVNQVSLDTWSFTPNIAAAGFFMYSNQSAADYIIVAIPEPTGVALIAAGLVMIPIRRAGQPRG